MSHPEFSHIAGKSVKDAEASLKKQGYSMRVTKEDGEDLLLNRDMCTSRVNVEVIDGKVTQVSHVG